MALCAGALLAASSVAACGSSNSTSSAKGTTSGTSSKATKTLTFGGMFPLTGAAAPIGKLQEQGANLAISQINSAGGVDGYRLKMVAVDHHGTAQGGAQAMSQLADVNHVPYVLSGFASVLLAAQPIAKRSHIVLMNTGGSGTELLGKSYLYNAVPNPGAVDPPLAKYAINQGKTTAAMLYSDDAFGNENASVFKSQFTKLGGKIVASQSFAINATDFTTQLSAIKSSNPQVLFIVSLGDTQALIQKQVQSLGMQGLLKLAPLLTPIYAVAGAAGNGYIGTEMYVDAKSTNPKVQAYVKGIQSTYNSPPNFSSAAEYQGVEMLAQLIRDCVSAGKNPTNGANLEAEIQQHPTFFDYASGGTVKILPNHDDIETIAIEKSQGNNLVPVQVLPEASSSSSSS